MSDLYRKRIALYGQSVQNALYEQSTDIKEYSFLDSVNYKKCRIDGKFVDAHFLISTEFSVQDDKGAYYIEFRRGVQYSMGTYVEIPNYKGEYEYWIITSKSDNPLFPKQAIQKCNHLLRWQDANGRIYERYCVLRRPYSSTRNDTDYFYYSNKSYRVMLPLDNTTKMIHIDQLFVIEESNGVPLTYACAAFDSVSEAYDLNETILIINLEQRGSLVPNDNLDEMIADYKKPVDLSQTWIDITSNSDVVRIGGTGTIFTAKVCDELEGYVVSWNVNTLDDIVNDIEFTQIDNLNMRVKAAKNHQIVGSMIQISACVADIPEIKAEKLIKVVGIV